MTLTLAIRNIDTLANGGPVRLELERRGAVLGRSPTIDWTLPDAANYISSRHCEIRFENENYFLRDTSINGTLVNGAPIASQHRLVSGDLITIGQYEIAVIAPAQSDSGAAEPRDDWGGWNSVAAPVGDSTAGLDWGRPAPKAPIAGDGVAGAAWVPPSLAPSSPQPSPPPQMASAPGPWGGAAPVVPPASNIHDVRRVAPPPVESAWGQTAPGDDWAQSANSKWSTPVAPPPPSASASDIWGRLADVHGINPGGNLRSRPAPPVAGDALGLSIGDSAAGLGPLPNPAPYVAFPSPGQPQVAVPPAVVAAAADGPPALPNPVNGPSSATVKLAALLGLAPGDLDQGDDATLKAICDIVQSMVSGLVVMLEARANAKAQLGAQGTILQLSGNNPLKFSRTPAEAIAQLINQPVRGFMPADQAIEDAFLDLQAHQMATLRAMQGALSAVLERFSPTAISTRTETRGLLEQIMPRARDAALWRAYVKEFSGVNEGSDEVFMEVFAREFRRAYEDESMRNRRPSPPRI